MKIYINILGIIAVFFWVLSIQPKEKKNILKLQIVANIFYSIQYFLLGGISASCMNIVSTIRSVIFYKNERENQANSKLILIIFLFVIALITVITYNGLLSLIPIVLTIMYTVTTWQKELKNIRIFFIIAAFIWIYYNLRVGATVSIIGNVFEIVSGIISIIRFDINKKIDKKEV